MIITIQLNVFTLIKWCGIILVVKRLALLTIPLAFAFAFGGVTASAAVNEPVYPERDEDFIRPLHFTSLNDYAVKDELFVFADGNSVKILDGNNYDKYDFDSEFTAVEIENGTIYCLSQGKAYYLNFEKDGNPFDEIEHPFPAKADEITHNGCYYFIDGDGLNIFNRSSKENLIYYGEYSNLKLCGDKVYAMKENSLYALTDTQCEKVVLEYEVSAKNIKIEIGQAVTALKQYSEVQFVKVGQGTVMTEVNLDNLETRDGCFETSKIIKAKENEQAILLCSLNDFAIVAISGNSYAVLNPTEKITPTANNEYATETQFDAQVTGGNIYASPFIADGTSTLPNALGVKVTVIRKIESEIFGGTFYEVEYQHGEKTGTGYVKEGFLTPPIREDVFDQTNHPDQHYSESSNTKTILIILAVIVLLLIAVVYVSYVSTKGKNKKKKKTDDQEE